MSGRRHDPGGPSLEALAGLAVGFPMSYLAAEGLLPGPLHPVHWLITALGAGAGYLVGSSVFHLKERRDLHGTFFGHAPPRGKAKSRAGSTRRHR